MLAVSSWSLHAGVLKIKQSSQGIAYVTGGISADEAEAIQSYISKFNVRLVFSEGTRGRYITDVNVYLYDNDGKLVFELREAQPQLLINVPNGSYTVAATYNGQKQRHKFIIGHNERKKIILNWKNLVEEDMQHDEATSE